MDKLSAKGRIRKARTEDIECIHEWLIQQQEENVHGSFLCNWNLIRDYYNKDELVVFIESKSAKAVAYQFGSLINPGILEVRNDMRGQGIGKRLVEYQIKEARREGLCILYIRCKPSSSIPFWKKMGFELIDGSENYAYQILKYELLIPDGGQVVEINIGLYPKSRQWDDTTQPAKRIKQNGTMLDDKVVHLSKRICIPNIQGMWDGDVVVEIEIDGKLIYRDKARYKNAQKLGVKNIINGYSIDRIYLSEKTV